MFETQVITAVIGVFASFIAAGFAWMLKFVESRKERDARTEDQLREIERLQIEMGRTLREMSAATGSPHDRETRDRWIEGRFDALSEHTHSIGAVLQQLVGPDAAARDAVRRELSFLAKRMVKLERAAPIHVRCDPSEARDGEVRCPYCHGDLGSVDLVRCSRCQARQHRECHQSHGSCAVFGCGGTETGDAVAAPDRAVEAVRFAAEAARIYEDRVREQGRARGA